MIDPAASKVMLKTDAGFCRAEALDKFGVINVQLRRLSEELRPLLKFYAVHPKACPLHVWDSATRQGQSKAWSLYAQTEEQCLKKI